MLDGFGVEAVFCWLVQFESSGFITVNVTYRMNNVPSRLQPTCYDALQCHAHLRRLSGPTCLMPSSHASVF